MKRKSTSTSGNKQKCETTETSSNKDKIFGTFGKGLQNLLEDAIADKSKELEKREITVTEREAKIDHILKETEKVKGCIKLQVGSVLFQTTSNTLLKIPDSFFHGLLNPNFKLEKDEPIFIDRDGKVFHYILEYLTYGELLSPVDDIGILKKLAIDAKYYLLDELAKEVTKLIDKYAIPIPSVGNSLVLCCFRNASLGGSGYYWSWNTTDVIDKNYFQLSTVSYQNDTITVLKPGFYHIIIRTACSTTSNYYSALYLNGNDVARCYCDSNGYYNTFHINEIKKLSSNDKLQVYQTYNNSPLNGDPHNVFQIICLRD